MWQAAGVRLLIKRDDLLVPAPGDPLQGNKCRKLKYNLLAARERGISHLLTLGGPYSNHLAAVASAGRRYGFQTTGLVRGEPVHNPTIEQLERDGMRLVFVSRHLFELLRSQQHLPLLEPPYYFIPEGGSNRFAQRGLAELADELLIQHPSPPDYVAISCGTGGSAAGLICGLNGRSHVLGFSALKGGFMEATVANWLRQFRYSGPANYSIFSDYHLGGFAKVPPQLQNFIREFQAQHDILLDPIYTGKLFFGLYNLLQNGYFQPGQTIVAIHTGGLQGIKKTATPPEQSQP